MIEVKLQIDGDIDAMMKDEYRAGERAVTATMRAAALSLKETWREQVRSAGLGNRLANAIRSRAYPQGTDSLNAAAMVWTKAPKIISAHESGVVIRARGGHWLAIPTPAAGKSLRGGRVTPAEWERRTGLRLQFIYRGSRPALLVAEGRINKRGLAVESRAKSGRGRVTAPIFILVPQVRLKKKLNLLAAAEQVGAGLPSAIIANWRSTR